MPANRKYTRKQSRSKNFVAIPVEGNLTLGTLNDQPVVKTGLTTSNLNEDMFVLSTDLSATLTGLTAGEGIPCTVGISHSDYSVTEIDEATDVELLGPGSKIEQERARRLVRKVGSVNESPLATQVQIPLIGRNGSRVIRTKCKFLVSSGKTLDIWLKNRTGSTITTGTILRFDGYIYGRWIV